MARYKVTMRADKAKYPVLLSNGNQDRRGRGGRQDVIGPPGPTRTRNPLIFSRWSRADLVAVKDFFTTALWPGCRSRHLGCAGR